MKLATIQSASGLQPVVLGPQGVLCIEGWSSLRELIAAGEDALAEVWKASKNATDWVPLSDVRLATPLPGPTKNIFCVGRNYKLHIIEMCKAYGLEISFPEIPEFFSKPPTTVIGPEDGIERHAGQTERLDYEVELAIVIGKKGRNIREEDAFDHVFGYTIVNDVSARDAQVAHGQFFKGKSFDTFCPIGPVIVTKQEFGDPSGHRLLLRVNGGIRQDSNTADMLFSVPQMIASLSAGLTLEPGDIIATGTPLGAAAGMVPPAWLQVGDVVEAEIEGIGILRNPVIA